MNALRQTPPPPRGTSESGTRISVGAIEDEAEAAARAPVATRPGEKIFTIEVQGVNRGFGALRVKRILEGFLKVRAASVDLTSQTATIAAPEQADPLPWLDAITDARNSQSGRSMGWVATLHE